MKAVRDRRPAAEPEGSESFRDWGRLMTLAQAGDHVAYATLLRALAVHLRSLALRHLGAGADVEDAVQEILLAVHAIRHTYDPTRPFGPWLVTIARRRLVDALRRRSRRLAREAVLDERTCDVACESADPSVLAARVVDIGAVRRAVGGLPPRQREAIQLLRLQEMSLHEAAAASGHSEGALKVAAHRGLRLMRTLLGRSVRGEHGDH